MPVDKKKRDRAHRNRKGEILKSPKSKASCAVQALKVKQKRVVDTIELSKVGNYKCCVSPRISMLWDLFYLS